MEDRSYIERRNMIKRAHKALPRKKGNYFILKLNMLLAVGIMVLCADIMDLDIKNTLTDKVKSTVISGVDASGIKTAVQSALHGFGNGPFPAFAGEEHPVTADKELIERMDEMADAYENAQKKTRPSQLPTNK